MPIWVPPSPCLPSTVMAEQTAAPAQDDRARYEAIKKELMQALPKKRVIDKQLVRILQRGCVKSSDPP